MRFRTTTFPGAWTAIMLLAACQAPAPSDAPELLRTPREQSSYFSDTRADVPADKNELRTTSGAIYLRNLNGRIHSLRRVVEARGEAPRLRLILAGSLHHRGRILGRVEDLERALVEVDRVLKADPDNAAALLARAGLYSAVHRFQDALADLEAAERGGASAEKLAKARAGILIALGNVAKAEGLAQPWLGKTLPDLVFRGNRRLDEGKLAQADRLFSKAQGVYHGISPLTMSWLHVQHGVAFLRNRDLRRARKFFYAAHERFPKYALATEHLAETELLLGNYQHAAELYRLVSHQTQNPVFYGKLAEAERALGNEAAAARADAKAIAGFESWLERHPEANWQHAAIYYLDRDNTDKALELARLNAELRQNFRSLLLLARAERAAGHHDAACTAWQRMLENVRVNGLRPPEIAKYGDGFTACDA